MHQRKQLMFERADAFIALPGGVGTLEELVEQLTWVQLQRHQKPVLLADIGGFWRPLLALFAHMRNLGFIREGFEVRYLVAEKIEDALPMLQTARGALPHRQLNSRIGPAFSSTGVNVIVALVSGRGGNASRTEDVGMNVNTEIVSGGLLAVRERAAGRWRRRGPDRPLAGR